MCRGALIPLCALEGYGRISGFSSTAVVNSSSASVVFCPGIHKELGLDRFVSFQIIWVGVRVIHSETWRAVGISEEVKEKKKKKRAAMRHCMFEGNGKTISFQKQ